MAQVTSEFNEYVGISNDTFTDGLHAVITAAIPEFHPLEKRDLGEMKVYKCETIDDIGKTAGCAKVQSAKTVVCTYFGNDGNHLIPCVHRGERVRVFNYAGTEQYYWKEWGRDMGLHKHERLRWFAMDKKNKGIHWSTDKKYQALPTQTDKYNDDGGANFSEEYTYSDVTDHNTYFIELNTVPGDKGIRIHTGIEDGEPYAYDICIWTESGVMEITDNKSGGGCLDHKGSCVCHMDTGNNIRLNSKCNWWHIRNVDNSVIDMYGKNITIGCPDTLTMIAGQKILMRSGMYYGLNAPMQAVNGTEITTTMSDSVAIHAPHQSRSGDDTVEAFKTGVYTYTQRYGRNTPYAFTKAGLTEHIGDLVNTGNIIDTGNVDITGNVSITGNEMLTGDLTVGGGVSAGGSGGFGGSGSFGGDATINGISFSGHTHTDSEGGTTTPPA